MSTLSGREYSHYYVTLVPILTLAAGYFIHRALVVLGGGSQASSRPAMAIGVLAFALSAAIGPLGATALTLFHHTGGYDTATRELTAQYLRQATTPAESVLMWGSEDAINYLSGRRSTTEFSYQLPLFLDVPGRDTRWSEFLKQVQAEPPTMIVDASGETQIPGIAAGIVLPLDAGRQQELMQGSGAVNNPLQSSGLFPRELEGFTQYVQTNYRYAGSIGRGQCWYVSIRRDSPNPSPSGSCTAGPSTPG